MTSDEDDKKGFRSHEEIRTIRAAIQADQRWNPTERAKWSNASAAARQRRVLLLERRLFLEILGRIQELSGVALAAYGQDVPGSAAAESKVDDVRRALDEVFDLCVRARADDPPT